MMVRAGFRAGRPRDLTYARSTVEEAKKSPEPELKDLWTDNEIAVKGKPGFYTDMPFAVLF
jgi:hypothetical protein